MSCNKIMFITIFTLISFVEVKVFKGSAYKDKSEKGIPTQLT